MEKEQISKIEEIIEKHLFKETNNNEYELKKMDVIIKYLIYEYLKEINENLKSINETLTDMANLGIWENEK
jgi:hypothetical protein